MRKRSTEDIQFLNELLIQAKEQLAITQRSLKRIERDFSRNPHDEFAEETIQEIYDSLQSLNQYLSISESEEQE